jgi:hypothetical protein
MSLASEIQPEHLSAWNIFNGDALRRMMEVEQSKARFVHYTSAEVAFSILQNASVWMRRPQLMNDFQEIEYGWGCLSSAWGSGLGNRFRSELDEMFEGSSQRILGDFEGLLPVIRSQTFMTCVSEHEDSEDEIGRLSMWRAYGGHAGVAMVLNSAAFTAVSDVFNAYTHPVFYHSPAEVERRIADVVDQVISSRNFLKSQGEDFVSGYVHDLLQSVVLCTKHPGFREEREWRIIHNSHPDRSPNLTYRQHVVRGIPQQIVELPLKDFPDEGLIGAAIPTLVDRIIIGPNDFAWEIRSAIIDILAATGVQNPAARVWVSDIPVRQQG